MNSTPIEISVHEVKQKLDQGEIVLIDCREPSEWDTAHINGAQLMPMSQWMAESSKLSQWKDQEIVVHCHHGGRSLRVTNWLRENGFSTARNMTGGIDAWSQNIDPNVPRY